MTETPALPDLSPTLDLSRRLACIMQTLRDIIAAHAGRDRSAVGIVLLLWPYLHRVVRRFEALARRVEAGGACVPARTRPTSLAPRVRPAGLRRPCLPRGFAWLIRLVPFGAAAVGGQVRHLLVDPEMASLFAAAPEAGRILRPLCRMLGIAPAPDLPAGLFRPRARRRSATVPDACGDTLTPALAPKRERETFWPVPDQWSTQPGNLSRRRARRLLPLVGAALA